MLNLSINNIPLDPNNGLNNVPGQLVKRAKLTKSMWLLVVIDILALFAVGLAVLLGVDLIALWKAGDLRFAFWIGVVTNLVLLFFHSIAEVVINHIHGRGLK